MQAEKPHRIVTFKADCRKLKIPSFGIARNNKPQGRHFYFNVPENPFKFEFYSH
jgi:hypothetical protein